MAIEVKYFERDGIAFKPENISFGDGETLEVKVNANGTVTNVPLVKRTVTLSGEGITSEKVTAFQAKRDANLSQLLNGDASGDDLEFGGYKIEKALLTKVSPSGPIIVAGRTIFDTCELEYSSQVFV